MNINVDLQAVALSLGVKKHLQNNLLRISLISLVIFHADVLPEL